MMKKSSYEKPRQTLQETILMPAKKAKRATKKLTKAHREVISRGMHKKLGTEVSVTEYLRTENDSALKRSSSAPGLKTGQPSQPLVAGIDPPEALFPVGSFIRTGNYNQTATLPVEQLVEEHIRWVKEYIARHRAAVLKRINY